MEKSAFASSKKNERCHVGPESAEDTSEGSKGNRRTMGS
jgi:hypothetical protein